MTQSLNSTNQRDVTLMAVDIVVGRETENAVTDNHVRCKRGCRTEETWTLSVRARNGWNQWKSWNGKQSVNESLRYWKNEITADLDDFPDQNQMKKCQRITYHSETHSL